MLQHKDIKIISELKNRFTPEWVKPDFVYGLFRAMAFSKLCKCLEPFKKRGYSFEGIFTILISMILMDEKTVNSMTTGVWSKYVEAHKDVFYRLKNNMSICWRSILWKFAIRFNEVAGKSTEYSNKIRCLIFDDTVLSKSGKKIEHLGRVWDHVLQRSILGFKMLVMCYWDGASCIPLDFSFHKERGKNKEKPFGMTKRDIRKQFKKRRCVNSSGNIRVNELELNKIDNALTMFRRAIKRGIKVDYLLMDSWFTCEAFIEAVKNVKNQTVHLIGMYKIVKQLFEYNGQMLTYSQILNIQGKPKRCRKAKLYYHQTKVTLNGNEIQLIFSRQGTNGKWKTFITTDLNLTFIKLIEIYQIRWTIEVFFKESKQLLGLGKSQSSDFDGQIADTTITLIQYILLTLKYRFDAYESKGKLFESSKREASELLINERLWGLLLELLNIIEDYFDLDAMELLEKIMINDEAYSRLKSLFTVNLEETKKLVA